MQAWLDEMESRAERYGITVVWQMTSPDVLKLIRLARAGAKLAESGQIARDTIASMWGEKCGGKNGEIRDRLKHDLAAWQEAAK